MQISKKNFTWNLVGTSFNAVTSLFYMIIVTRTNGLSDSGLFTLAFSIACLLCNIGGYQGRVYQVTDAYNEFSDREYIVHRIVTCFLMMVIALGYVLFMNYDSSKMAITLLLCFLKCLEVFADVFYGILQKNDLLYKVGFSLFLKSILSILVFLIINYIFHNLLLSCFCLVIVWFVILLTYDIANSLSFIDDKFDFKNMLSIFKSGFFSFAVLFLSVYVVNAPRYALDGRVIDSLIAIYGIIVMPGTLISLSAQYLLHPFLHKLSISYTNRSKNNFSHIVNTLVISILGIGLLVIIVAFFIGIPLLELVYAVKLDKYLYELLIILFGSTVFAGCTILSAALTTIRHTFVQFIIYAITGLFGFIASPILIHLYSIGGACIAYTLIMSLEFIIYFCVYYYLINKKVKWNNEVETSF